MPVFNIGETITTGEARIEAEELPVGDHTFQLVVEDDQGQRSDPDRVRISVRRTRPTAILAGPEGTVELGDASTLDGTGSSAVEPATLSSWEWTLQSSEEPNPDNP